MGRPPPTTRAAPKGENGAADTTTARFDTAVAGRLGQLGPAGQPASQGLGLITTAGTTGAAAGADVTNQMGVGHTTNPPDFTQAGRRTTNDTNPNGDTRIRTGADADDPADPTRRTDSGPGGVPVRRYEWSRRGSVPGSVDRWTPGCPPFAPPAHPHRPHRARRLGRPGRRPVERWCGWPVGPAPLTPP